MDVLEAIETTRAVRRYADAPVSDHEILRCIQAAVHGPSGGNIQPWQFLAVTDAAVKRAIADVYRRAYDRYEPAVLRIRQPLKNADGRVCLAPLDFTHVFQADARKPGEL